MVIGIIFGIVGCIFVISSSFEKKVWLRIISVIMGAILVASSVGIITSKQDQNNYSEQLQVEKNESYKLGEKSVQNFLTQRVDLTKIPVKGKAVVFVKIRISYENGKFESMEFCSTEQKIIPTN